jgi:hypothetical protein
VSTSDIFRGDQSRVGILCVRVSKHVRKGRVPRGSIVPRNQLKVVSGVTPALSSDRCPSEYILVVCPSCGRHSCSGGTEGCAVPK